ncbi:MAG: GH32 C-terminal domain-containing protein [Candidatus Omnitrophica bacterium]|nr:GH32 C-terminal domain-containing protein [Candidatus Omnitrophota bacterium]
MKTAKTTPLVLAIACVLSSLPALQAESASKRTVLTDKTLVAWVCFTNVIQRGGSVLTLENPGGEFDAMVFGEIKPGKWMAGSDYFRRTQQDQDLWPNDPGSTNALIQLAIVYRGRQVSIYRNGRRYAEYAMQTEPATFDTSSRVLMGLRHTDAARPNCFFTGSIEDARIYDQALDEKAIENLRPNEPSTPKPLAWWSFERDTATDLMGAFPAGRLFGGATISGGRLHLPGPSSYFATGGESTRTRETEDWPTWHVTALPEEGVCLPYDANGCIYWKGTYHLMYIFQDPTLPNGGHCWGHLSSTDLVNWTYLPTALAPHPGDPDLGIFSGNAFTNKAGVPMLCWFGIDAGVCVATAQDDNLIHWKKHPGNPIIPIPKPGSPAAGIYKVWDPYIWLEGDTYYCLLGGNKLPNGKDTLYVMKSADLVHWQPLHPFYEHPDLSWTTEDEDCSCPDFFQLGNQYVLLCISHKVGARCYIGRFDPRQARFFPEQHVRMNWPGGTFFAPESLLDNQGRRIFWAWVTDPRLMSTQRATGSGTQSLPRVLALGPDGTVRITPVKELESLRRDHRQIEHCLVKADSEVVLPGIRGDSMELALEIAPGTASEIGLKVRCSPDGEEETGIWYNAPAGKLIIDMSRSTLRKDVKYSAGPIETYFGPKNLQHRVEAPFHLPPNEPLRLRVFMDKPMLEVFANDRQCVTQQIFPKNREATGIKLCAKGGDANARVVDAWQLAPARFSIEK